MQHAACKLNFDSDPGFKELLTSCKPPDFKLDDCCRGFRRFVCPHEKFLNDLSSDCSATMFNKFHAQGYPKGFFFSKCIDHDGQIDCADI
ncbi:GPI-anchored protein LORELEI [Linum perenne]